MHGFPELRAAGRPVVVYEGMEFLEFCNDFIRQSFGPNALALFILTQVGGLFETDQHAIEHAGRDAGRKHGKKNGFGPSDP